MIVASPILLALQLLGTPVVDAARDTHQQARTALTQVERGRAELSSQHEHLAGEIAALKTASGPLLRGVSDGRLDAKLKEAQVLAEQLEGLDRQVVDARERVGDARVALVQRLDVAVAAQRRAMAAAPPAERRARFQTLGKMVAERATLLTETRRAPTERVELPATDGEEDPETLRLLKEETEDHVDRVRGDLERLQKHLKDLQERQRLHRADRAFERDTQLFREDERSRRLATATTPGTGVASRIGDPGRTRNTATDKGPAEDDGDGIANVAGQRGGDEGGAPNDQSPSPPPAAPEDGDNDESENFAGAGEAADPSPGRDAEPDAPTADNGGALDETPAAPEAFVAGGNKVETGDADLGGAVIVQPSFEPGQLEGDIGELSSQDIEARIRQVRASEAALKKKAAELEARRKALEEKAENLEQ